MKDKLKKLMERMEFTSQALRKASDEERTRQDRRALAGIAVKGALVAGAAGLLIHRRMKSGPAPVGGILEEKLAKQQAKKAPRPLGKSALKDRAWQNSTTPRATGKSKRSGADALQRREQADKLRWDRGYQAVSKPFGKRAPVLPESVRTKAGGLLQAAKSGEPKLTKKRAAQVTAGEKARATAGYRKGAREELARVRKENHFERKEERDTLSKVRDVAIIGGAGAAGVGALAGAHQARKLRKEIGDSVRYAAGSIGRAARRVDPASVAAAGAQLGKDSLKKGLKKHFPTFTRWGKAAAGMASRQVFETPAEQLGLIEFIGMREQMRNQETDVFAGPLKVMAGVEKAYVNTPKGPREVLPGQVNAQAIRAAYRTAGTVHKAATRTGSFVSDAGDVIAGRPRKRDSAGRERKREWEKSWFKDGVRKATIGAGMLAGAYGLHKNPGARDWLVKKSGKVMDKANEVVADAFPRRSFATPAERLGLIEFDEVAADAGWDIRDPRGKSARVFAPGSRRRVRREKEWHEKVENERKIRTAAGVAALGIGVASGAIAGRALQRRSLTKQGVKLPQKPVKPAAPVAPDDNIVKFRKRA